MLSFVWKIRDRSAWRVTGIALLLAVCMGLFFLVFRITYPAVRRADAVPQHVLVLDPADAASLAIIHRAQDRSFGLVPAEPLAVADRVHFPAFTPGFAGARLELRPMLATSEAARQPRIFSAATSVLPAVPPRTAAAAREPALVLLKAVLPAELSRRAPASLEIKDVPLADPENARFRISVAASGQVMQALPLFTPAEPSVTNKLRSAVLALRFQPDAKAPTQWTTLAFEWQNAAP